jgi:hypothetical protein
MMGVLKIVGLCTVCIVVMGITLLWFTFCENCKKGYRESRWDGDA